MAIHRDLPDSELHEPKGVVSASANQVYVSDGVGSGAWEAVFAENVQITDSGNQFTATNVEDALIELLGTEVVIHARLTDVSTPSAVLIPVLNEVELQRIRFVLGGAITTADSTITVTRGGDGASMGTQLIPFSGSAEGTTFDFTPTGNNIINPTTHKYFKIATDGNSSTAQPLYMLLGGIRT